MKRTGVLLLSIFSLLFFAACSNDEPLPSDRFDTYTNHWNNLEFNSMYDMLSENVLENVPTDQFIDRYNKIYSDLNIVDLHVSYDELTEDQEKTALEEGVINIPFTAKMESVAGSIEFEYEATLLQEGEDDEKDWFIQWDSGFIFPELADGGEISFQSEKPRRGEILDRNKMPLAINDFVYEVGVVPGQFSSNETEEKKSIAKLLNMSVDNIETALSANWVQPDLYVPLKKISQTDENTINELRAIDAVDLREVTGRVYPLGHAASHLIGYIGEITAEELEKTKKGTYSSTDEIGKRGLELFYEDKLKGEQGLKIIVTNEDGDQNIIAEKSVKNGESVTLTIDANIQEKVYKSYDGESGTAAAINPKTGETLALTSNPGFDPNTFVFGLSQKQRETLENDPKKPLINRFTAKFAPGSAIKPITAAIGLENGTIVEGQGVEISGLTWDNGKGWGDYQVRRVSTSTKPVDVADALIRSDNIYFAMKAVEMGNKSLIKGLTDFGFDNELPFAYPITTSTISSDGKLDGEVEVANTSYGQGEIEASALHLGIMYTPFINKGNLIKPTLLQSDKTEDIWKEKVISEENANLVDSILRDVVVKGTAKIADNEKLAISGKTGTAELKLSADSTGEENAWFVGYPTEKKDMLIAMLVENTKDLGASSFVAEKVAKLLIEFD